MTSVKSREIHLRSRPHGLPTADNFALANVEVPAPSQPDQVLVRNRFISVDPYMRGRMRDTRSYTPPFGLDEPLTGGAVGEVVSSTSEAFAEGDFVLHMLGWREYALAEARHLTKVDPSLGPLQSYLGVLGMPGMTAYVGLLDIGEPQPGETVFVSGAAGAVGSEVCQIAKIKGCRVVGICGTEAKCRHIVDDLGFDAAVNYRTDSLDDDLAAACPDGIDVIFENVGGEILEAMLRQINLHARIALCGAIAQYHTAEPPLVPPHSRTLHRRRARMQGFLVNDFAEQDEEAMAALTEWVTSGQIVYRESIVDWLESAAAAFVGLFSGANTGKQLVRVGDASD